MKKIGTAIIVILLVAVSVFIGLLFFSVDSDKYTETQHLNRISERVKKRFINERYGFTGYKLYPLYNEQEEMEHCLVEFKPSGFFCIKINKKSSVFSWRTGMYLIDPRCTDSNCTEDPWQRFRILENIDGLELYPKSQWKAEKRYGKYFLYEVDQNGEYVYYNTSPFQVANVLEERKYCFEKNTGCVFAVKRDGQYFNLVTMQIVTEEDYKTAQVNIIYDPILNL